MRTCYAPGYFDKWPVSEAGDTRNASIRFNATRVRSLSTTGQFSR